MALKTRGTIFTYIRGEEKGESRIGFLHKDFAATRHVVATEWGRTVLILCVVILAILSIFWGAFLHILPNLKHLKVFVVNFDHESTGVVGTQVVQLGDALAQAAPAQLGFGWEVVSPDVFNNDPLEVRRAVYEFDAWAAVIVYPNASSNLRAAVEDGISSYDPAGAAEIVYVGSRETYAMPNYVVPGMKQFAIMAGKQVGTAWAREVLQNATTSSTNLAAVPQALNPAIEFTIIDLRPVHPTQVIPAVTVGALYLIVVSFFSYAFFLPTHTHFVSEIEGHRKLFFHQLVIWKYLSATFAYFFLSLSYSFVSLAFQIPFSNSPASPVEPSSNANAYGHASFFVFWMINWLGMIALGLASENMAMILGQPWAAAWLVFWIISNVCTALYPIDLAPRFYYYGFAFPLHNIVEASRQIIFDLHSRIGLNIGVLLAWWAVNTALFPLCAWFFRYKYFRALRK